MDSPAEYVAKLESELRTARGEAEQLRRELTAADELRGGLAGAAVDTAQNFRTALEWIEAATPVVEAAVFYAKGSDNLDRLEALFFDAVEGFAQWKASRVRA